MKKHLLALVFVGFACQLVLGQTGHYFLSHYKPENDNVSYLSFDIRQDNNGILYFANRSGVLQFDGRTWTMVPIIGVYSLAVTPAGEVYASGITGFGKIGLNELNELSYIPLSDSLPKARNIFASLANENVVYFLSESQLYEYNTDTHVSRILFTANITHGNFTSLFRIGSSQYLNTENGGLKKIQEENLMATGLPQLQKKELVFVERSPDQKTDLIATGDNHFFMLKEGQPLRRFQPNDSLYLISNVVANGTWVTDKLLAIGTLRGGIVFVDSETGKTEEILNYHAGLPDNEIYALHSDGRQGVWVAHDYGFTRVAPFLPFRTYNHYPGLAGNLLCVQSFFGQVYVGTTLGLFCLSKEEMFVDQAYTTTQTKTETFNVDVQDNLPLPQDEVKQSEHKKRKFGFMNILKKKKKEEVAPAPVIQTPKAAPKPSTKSISKTTKTQVRKTRKVLSGIEYVYKPVTGIYGKVDQLIPVENKLIAAGVGGVFEVNGLSGTPLSREPVRTIFFSRNLKELLVSTYNDEIKTFRSEKKGWKQTNFPDTLSAYADYFFEDNLQNLWICERDRMVRVGVEEGEILDADSIPLPSVSVDRTVGLSNGQEVYLTHNGAFYHYASFKNQFVKYDSFAAAKKYFASAGYFWFYDGHKWRTFDSKLQAAVKTEWLSLFPDIRYLGPADQGKSLWVITADNELYKFTSEQGQVPESNPLFLKEVRSLEHQLSPTTSLLVEEGESALTFKFMQPEYISLEAVEYRYWVQGIHKAWSDWSTLNNVIIFSYLPTGKYKVLVEAKELFGRVTKLDNIDLEVVPPYWKRTWFYALELLVFGSLVVLSLRLNVAKSRYRYLSRFLSALTIVLFIQFIQTIATANITLKSTPVADFFIQVVIALLVLPVEEFLRTRIVKAGNEGKS